MKRWSGVILTVAALMASAPALLAQDDSGPQILTSDLAIENEVSTGTLSASFAIVSDAPITKVTIDGVDEPITPADTVLITKTFTFTKQRSVVTIVATDQNGKTRERAYAVRFAGAQPEQKLTYFVSVKAAFEVDGNPTNDISSPIAIEGVDIKGVVDDSEQPDTRYTLQATGALTYGKWTGFAGALMQAYGKADNDGLNTQMIFMGGSGRFNLGGTRDAVLTYVFTDLNVGDNDYAQMHSLGAAYETRSSDNQGKYTHVLGVDFTSKDFASATQEDGGQYGLRWAYKRVDAAGQDQFDSIIGYGSATEGIEEQDYTYLGGNWDWINRWDRGLRVDWGLGLEYRSFAEDDQPLTDEFGPTRLDTLWRFSIGAGWQINPKWSAMFNYRYLTDISNKAPYVRPIYGVTVEGAF